MSISHGWTRMRVDKIHSQNPLAGARGYGGGWRGREGGPLAGARGYGGGWRGREGGPLAGARGYGRRWRGWADGPLAGARGYGRSGWQEMARSGVNGGRRGDKPRLRIEFRRCGGQRFLGFGTEAFEIFDLGKKIAGAGLQFAQGTVVGFAKAPEVFADFL